MTTDLTKLRKLSRDARALLDSLADRLPDGRLANLRTYRDVGEHALLVNGICATLVKRQIPVTARERDQLADLLSLFDKPVRDGAYIDDDEATLAALNVTEPAAD